MVDRGHPTERCECGHPREAHGPQEYPGRFGQTKACRATITAERAQFNYDRTAPGPRMWDSWPCKCQFFKEAVKG